MSPQPGDDISSPDSLRPSGIASVFRGLTGSKSSTKSPPPLSSSAAALPRTDFIHATPISSRGLSANHMDAFEQLKNGSPAERMAAANTLKFAITEYPLNPVLDIWYAAKDLIEPSKPTAMRQAGWELLTECVKHSSSTDLERKEYFQTIAAPANPEDFHLQLAALVDLTHRGRVLAGFDYELLPLLTKWLQEAYNAARAARKASQATRGQRTSKNKAAATGEDQNFAQLFAFIMDVIKFNFNTADQNSITGLIDRLLGICMSTSVEEDLRSCISAIDAIVTFGSVPTSRLKSTIQVLSSIFCLVHSLHKESWHTLANLCKSHNGQAAVRILLDVLRNPSLDEVSNKDMGRDIRGALAVLQKLLSKTTEKGYPTVPYALLVDGLANTLRISNSPRIYHAILQLINSLFNDGNGQLHRLVLDEDWSVPLDTAAECYRRIQENPDPTTGARARDDSMDDNIKHELQLLIARLDQLVTQKSGDFVPRQTVVKFFTDVHRLLPDNTARTVLDYFQEFRCCSPSDLRWEENLTLVLDGFFRNRSRSSETRLRALQTMMDAYEIVDLVGDGDEQDFIPRLAKSILQDVTEEVDVLVLDAIISFMTSVVVACDIDLFDFVINALRVIVVSDRLKSPIASHTSPLVLSIPPVGSAESTESASIEQSPSNVVTRGYVRMFMRLMNFHNDKSVKLFNVLVSIAKLDHCEVDARLTAMKLLFRLRADWADRVFITNNLDAMSTATTLLRTEGSLAKKQAEEVANTARLSRGDIGLQSRTSTRGASIGQGRAGQRQGYMWKYPDPNALPEAIPSMISPVLRSHLHKEDGAEGEEQTAEMAQYQPCALDLSAWLDTVLSMLQGCDWEIYSFVLVHLPSQLSNHAIFRDAIPQIQELRRVICEQIRLNSFQEPPNALGLRRADIAICLYHSLTMILSYHEHFQKAEEDEIVKMFVHGISTWERAAKCCIHALSICCHELPLSTSRSLIQMLNQMAAIITQPFVSVHILEFLACLSRLHNVYVNFREDEFRIVFAICFRYLEYAKDKRQVQRTALSSELPTPVASSVQSPSELSQPPTDDLPQYVHALAYHVILFWFLALKLPDRANHVSWIVKKLFADADGLHQGPDDHAVTSIDFMQRVTYADVDESAEDPYFTEDRFGDIAVKRWLVGNSIVTVKQATVSGWAQIIKRQPSGTSAYTVRESYRPPPPHQVENHVDITREGQPTSNLILPSHLLVQLMSPIPQTHDSARPIPLPDDEATGRTIRVFDRLSSLDGHKVGVIYIGEGQTEEAEILANVSGSSDYIEFLNNLGTLTKLKGATFNTQGLDREHDTDGQYTFCWRDRVTEIVFHVTTQMPTNLERDPHCIAKKRHIGNDFVNIIFNDSGLPFKFDTFPSQFNCVNIVITPASPASFLATREANPEQAHKKKFYTVQVMSKPGFPAISPASDTKMVSLKALPAFIRLLALNASVFAHVWHNREGGEHISSWSGRLREIKRLREKHGPKAGSVSLASPPTLLTTATPVQSPPLQPFQDLAQPGGVSSVRDSFNSLRRTSVATFFTNTSEQTSHRSSILSTAPTNDTEVGMNGLDSLVEAVDFSKWG
ncbi:Rap-RAN GTPase activating protein tuberin [Trichoderma parareesei]|uniref:Rap-RAN GTPase activating protein tuberin n=1 Tax=Trichoderma parareesei TaxID=858221 RepID=A0A2H2ZRI6_TRIPA|nr:Rap-RAN GTPase activating protein tuberin [Trichoderma parareesei]